MNKAVIIILIAVCAVVFVISADKLLTYFGADKEAESGFANLLPEEIAGPDATVAEGGANPFEAMLPYYLGLREDNPDFVGWLRIPFTRVSYPVMQTPDSPEFYLDRNFDKKYSTAGTLFAADISDVELPSDVVIIYGHRMKTGAMFGSLGDFLDEDFLKDRDTIVFDTFAGRKEYKVYCTFVQAVNVEGEFMYYNYSQFFNEEMFDRFMQGVDSNRKTANPKFRPVYGDKLILLSTCEYTHADGRLILVGVLDR